MALDIVPSGGTMAAAPSALPPQRLNEIMEALHRSILFDEEVKDYHFIVGPADHHGIWRGGLAELGLLNNFLDGNIQSHFDSDTGSLMIANMSDDAQFELEELFVPRFQGAMAANDLLMTSGLARAHPGDGAELHGKVPHCLLALYPDDKLGTSPSLVVHCTVGAAKRERRALSSILGGDSSTKVVIKFTDIFGCASQSSGWGPLGHSLEARSPSVAVSGTRALGCCVAFSAAKGGNTGNDSGVLLWGCKGSSFEAGDMDLARHYKEFGSCHGTWHSITTLYLGG